VIVWPNWSLEECQSQLPLLSVEWQKLVDAIDLGAEIPYTNSKGENWTDSVWDMLTHVPMHSAYHRGQIAVLLRSSGSTPAYTDFIHAARQEFIPE